MPSETVGVIGLGLLGGALAERLLGAGYAVLGWDTDAARREALSAIGGRVAPAREAAGCDRLLLSLPTSAVVATVLDEVEESLAAGGIVIDTTTGEPSAAVAAAERLARRGAAYLDATVAGSSAEARAGEVVLMVGGDPAACERCTALFASFARRWFHTGGSGSGATMKLVVNLVLGLNRAVLAEGLALAGRCGLDLGLTLEILSAGAAYSQAMEIKGPKMIAGDFEPQARLSQHLKDVRLILELGDRAGARLPLSAVHRELLEAAEAMGLGELDNSAILRAIEAGGSAS